MKTMRLGVGLIGSWFLLTAACGSKVDSGGGQESSRPGAASSPASPSGPPSVAPPLPLPVVSVSASASSFASAALGSASSFASGSAAAVAEAPPPCPSDMVLVGRVCVDPYEGFLQRQQADGTLVDHPYFERPEKGVRYLAANRKGAFPQGYISRVESQGACEAAGKRLCTRGEWTRACRGKGFSLYPYGHKGVRSKCNTGKLHLLTKLFKKPNGGMKYDEHFNSPELNKTPDYLSPGGGYSECVNEQGVYDAVGNLHEWVSGTVDQDLMDTLDKEDVERRKQPWREGNGIFMGGFFSTTSEHGPGCSFITVAHEPSYHDYSTGFRCCKNADLPKPEKKPATKPAKPKSAK
jgi:sulfatase modifying factor 1